jgi:hypothetical protein
MSTCGRFRLTLSEDVVVWVCNNLPYRGANACDVEMSGVPAACMERECIKGEKLSPYADWALTSNQATEPVNRRMGESQMRHFAFVS